MSNNRNKKIIYVYEKDDRISPIVVGTQTSTLGRNLVFIFDFIDLT